MNRTTTLIYLVCLLITGIAPSCHKEETQPRNFITSDLIWDVTDKNAVFAQQFLNSIYTNLPTGFNRINGDYLDDASGDAVPSRNNTSVQYYYNGIISTINNPDPYWANAYAGIRQANIFLANIDQVPTAAISITTWKAEVRFIRAFLYFELWKRYGGVPLVGDKVFTLNDNLQLPRNTYDDCLNYIVSECDAIKGNLNADALPAPNIGHIPKGAASALKCRAYLYAASPLFNGGNADGLTGSVTSDPSRWQKAIDAADELRALNYYVLEGSYGGLFTNKTSKEIILAKQSANNFDIENNNAPIGYVSGSFVGAGRTSPTQNFVDAFTMNNGLVITDPASGYNPAQPYTNRDPRFAPTVFFTGVKWLSRNMETFEGGKDKPGGSVVQTKTGYYLRKFMGDFTNSTAYSNQSHNFIYFRYAEILLNEAEAYNELGGTLNTESAVQLIIPIRKRAGITAGINGRYGIAAGISQNDMRTLIMTERRIELSFEEHRFWDVRRWKIANTALSGPLFGTVINNNAGVLTFQAVQVDNMVFQDKLYHMPIPYDEIVKNSSMKQNPGW